MTTKKTDEESRRVVLNRVARLEGQVKAVGRMIESGDRCLDVLTQIMAVRSAATNLAQELLKQDLLCGRRKGEVTDEQIERIFKAIN